MIEKHNQIKEIQIPVFTSQKEAKAVLYFLKILLENSNFNSSVYVYPYSDDEYSISILCIEIPELFDIWNKCIEESRLKGAKIIKIFR